MSKVHVVAVHIPNLDQVPHDTRLWSLLDSESIEKIKRFYHKADAQRCLIARLLSRHVLASSPFNIPISSQQYAVTEHGRPYLRQPLLDGLDFNITHDSSFVAISYITPGFEAPKMDRIGRSQVGVDVMRVQLPRNETWPYFLEAMWDQLSPEEQRDITLISTEDRQLRYLMLLWTHKEALTKSLGVGLGFDFSKISMRFSDLSTSPDSLRLQSSLEGKADHFQFQSWMLQNDHLLTVCLRQGLYKESLNLQLKDEDVELKVFDRDEFFKQVLENL